MSNHYSDLHVVNHERHLIDISSVPEANGIQQDPYLGSRVAEEYSYHDKQPHHEIERWQDRKKICGIRKKTFLIVVAVATSIVIVAAVSGGVAGGLSSKSHDKDTTPTDAVSSVLINSSIPTPSSASLTESTSTISTATVLGPLETLLVDCPSSDNTVYKPPGSSQMFRKACGTSFVNQLYPGDLVNTLSPSLDSCISLCAAYNVRNASEIQAGHSKSCNAVCWRATIEGDDWPGYCFGYQTLNISTTFNYGNDTRCNSAALIN